MTSTFFTAIPPALGEESMVNFGPLITKIKWWNHTHPNQLFRVIWPYKGGSSKSRKMLLSKTWMYRRFPPS